jgi:hypothetical protein
VQQPAGDSDEEDPCGEEVFVRLQAERKYVRADQVDLTDGGGGAQASPRSRRCSSLRGTRSWGFREPARRRRTEAPASKMWVRADQGRGWAPARSRGERDPCTSRAGGAILVRVCDWEARVDQSAMTKQSAVGKNAIAR